MPLPWVRLDTSLPSNPKILALLQQPDGHRAAFAYICGLAYSGAHGLDGFLSKECLPFIHANGKDARLLTRFNLWVPVAGGGWQINGWAEFQQSSEEAQKRRQRAIAAARARWNGSGDDS